MVISPLAKERMMFDKKELQTLIDADFKGPVLSVYLNTHPAEEPQNTSQLRLRSLLDEVDGGAENVGAVVNYFDTQYQWKNYRSAVVFSAEGQGFFKAYPLQVPVENQARVGSLPFILPLVELYNAHSGNGVALVNQQGSRFLFFQMGELREEQEFQGEDVQRQKHGGGSQTTGTWRGDEGAGDSSDQAVVRNLRAAGESADRFFTKFEVRRVFLGGTDQNIASFKQYLPKRWQSLILDEFQIDFEASPSAVRDRLQVILTREERLHKRSLVEQVITESAKGRHGLLRIDDILGAVREGRVLTLLVDRNFRGDGYCCEGCGYLTVQDLETCPFCGAGFGEIQDLGSMMVSGVLSSGGSVRVLEGEHDLKERGNIGALLRY